MSNELKNDEAIKNEKNNIFIKLPKALVGEPFLGKNDREYREIKVPNEDPNDKSSWQTFVVGANQVHLDKYSKGRLDYLSLKEDSEVALKKSVLAGTDENGKNVYETVETKVSAKALKERFDSDRAEYRESMKDSVTDKITKNQETIAKNEGEGQEIPNMDHEFAPAI